MPCFANGPVIGCAELSHHTTEQHALCKKRRRLPYFANGPVIGGAELSHHTTEQQALREQRRMLLFSRTDQISVVRNSHTTAQNCRLRVSRDECYYISRTDQLSVVRNSHITAQNSTLCVSRHECYLISRTDQLSVVRNSHIIAFNSRSRGPEYPNSVRVENHRWRRRLKPKRLSTCATQ